MINVDDINVTVIKNQPALRIESKTLRKCAGINTDVKLYDIYKLSIMFTNGMAAIKENQIYTLEAGDLIIFRPEELHFARFLRDGVHRYLTLLIPMELMQVCGGESLTRMFTDPGPERVNYISPSPEERVEILRRGEQILTFLEKKPEAWELRIFSQLIELLAICLPLYYKQKQHPEISSVPAVVTSALHCISTRYAELSSLSEIADDIGCSVSYLTRLFRQHTGKTVHSYLTECRIVHAKRFLELGLSVTEACYRTGFYDCSSFIRIFRANVGITPLQYKKMAEK